MKKGNLQSGHELYQYKYLPNVLQNINHDLFIQPSQQDVDGDIRIGYIRDTNIIFSLYLKEVVRHFLGVGASGSGKTNLMRLLMIELHRLGVPFICFDLVKYSARYLLHYMPDLILLRWNIDFFFNPLQPPIGVIIKVWRMLFCEITSEILKIQTASTLYLNKLVQSLYDKFETEKTGRFPNVLDINNELENRKTQKLSRNEIGYLNVISNKIDPVCATLDECLNVQEGLSMKELLKHPVCIELVGIKSSEIQTWLMSLILAWIISYWETQPMQFGKLRHVFFFDEADRVLGKGDE